MAKVSIIMVCLGNICRSPLAEGILQTKLNSEIATVTSAGTGNWHIGEHPDKRAIKIAKKHAIDISNKKAKQFQINDFDTFDYIYVMDKTNYQDIIALARNQQDKDKVHLLLNQIYPNQQKEVPDPYYGGENGFKKVYDLLDAACETITSKIQLNQQQND